MRKRRPITATLGRREGNQHDTAATGHPAQKSQALIQECRRTGVTLEDTGIRDENGMEPLPSFSSPQKLETAMEDGIQQMVSYTADDSMEMAQSELHT